MGLFKLLNILYTSTASKEKHKKKTQTGRLQLEHNFAVLCFCHQRKHAQPLFVYCNNHSAETKGHFMSYKGLNQDLASFRATAQKVT